MTTFNTFLTGLRDLEVTGVNRIYKQPPTVLTDLPAQWVQFPESDNPMLTFRTHGGWPTLRCQLIIAYEATVQGTQYDNFWGTVGLMDNLNTALAALDVTTVCKSGITWSLRQGEVTVGEATYWGIVADIVGNG